MAVIEPAKALPRVDKDRIERFSKGAIPPLSNLEKIYVVGFLLGFVFGIIIGTTL
tara:strand:- start:86 stop:250 length:165 start_codon:yes stop_codon:yes gene_type:complete